MPWRGQSDPLPYVPFDISSGWNLAIKPRVHELRVQDIDRFWRIVYRLDPDAVIIAAVFAKKTGRTPQAVIARCRQRFRAYDRTGKE